MTTFVTGQGSIFDSGADALVNPVNCVGVMGAGLARQYARRYPAMVAAYRRRCASGQVRPGVLDVHEAFDPIHRRGLVVVNLPTKEHWREDSRLELVDVGLRALAGLLVASPELGTVAVPALGCGLGGLDWRQVEPLVRDRLDGIEGLAAVLYPPATHHYWH